MSWRAQLGRQLRELRVTLSSTSDASSAGTFNYLNRRAVEFRMLNPNFPLYVREGDAIDPYLIAYYDWGETSTHDLTNKSPEEIDGIIKNIVVSKMNDGEYQKTREHRPAPWLRRPPDVVDEMNKPCEAIPIKLPAINNWSPKTGISPPGREVAPAAVLQQVEKELKEMGEKIKAANRAEELRKEKQAAA